MRRFFGNLKMIWKIMLGPVIVLMFLLALAATAMSGFSSQQRAISDLFNIRFHVFQDSAGVLKSVTAVHGNLYKMLTWLNTGFDQNKIDKMAKDQLAEIDRSTARLQKILSQGLLLSEEAAIYQTALKQLDDYKKPVTDAIELAAADVNVGTMLISSAAEDKFQLLQKSLNDLVVLEESLSRQSFENAEKKFKEIMRVMVLVVSLASILAVAISIFLAKMVTSPIRGAVDVIQQIAEGDLTREIPLVSRDEIGDLAHSVNDMRLKMHNAVGRSVVMSRQLADASSTQAANLEETSSSLEEMSAMIKQNAQNTALANTLMNTAQDITTKANVSVDELSRSIADIAQASEKTRKIVKTIDEIAFQTNLLALNAAVEAARAGQAGAGFAVVADEVRNLAMRAAESARNTAELIGDIAEKIKHGESQAAIMNEAFHQIDESSGNVLKLVEDIASASQQQAQGIDQINQAVVEVSRVTQENAASSQELMSIMEMFKTDENMPDNYHTAQPDNRLPQQPSRKRLLLS
ncbi:MAG: methyl-accepting chemotaxis protein [Pseudomonadota bacterium]